MGLTGLMLLGFVIIHLLGNMLIYSGPDAINAYGEFLQSGTHGLIWVARGGLIGAVLVHIWSAVSLTRLNHQARGENYTAKKKNVAT